MASQLYTALRFHGFSTCIVLQLLQKKKHEGTKRESRDATNTIAGYSHGVQLQFNSVRFLTHPRRPRGS